jgi:hypothetical protein
VQTASGSKTHYVYEYITKLCGKEIEVVQNHLNPNLRATGQGEAVDRKYKRLQFVGGQFYDSSSD